MVGDNAKTKKLRLLTARLFTIRLRNPEFREKFTSQTGWTMKSPIVPCEAGTLFGEVYRMTVPLFEETGAAVVAVPVLFADPGAIRLEVLTMRCGDAPRSGLSSIGIDEINHGVAMSQVCETLAPGKRWDIRDIDNADQQRIVEYI